MENSPQRLQPTSSMRAQQAERALASRTQCADSKCFILPLIQPQPETCLPACFVDSSYCHFQASTQTSGEEMQPQQKCYLFAEVLRAWYKSCLGHSAPFACPERQARKQRYHSIPVLGTRAGSRVAWDVPQLQWKQGK